MTLNLSTCNRLIAVFIAIVCVWSSLAFAEKTPHVLIVSNSNDTPYRETISGFKQSAGFSAFKFTELTLAQTQPAAAKQIDTLKPDLIFALGGESIKWASLQTSHIPIIATLVLKEDALKQAPNISGISLNFSLQTQFQWLKKFFPQQTSVAILYNPSENTATINTAKTISQQAGLKLTLIPVVTPKELPYALEQLQKNVEILLAIPDDTVMSVNTAKEVLLASFRNKVPLVGLSDNWVKSGAFYALSWDYIDLGAQCAAMAQKVLNGAPVQTLLPELPRKVTYTINAKIAEHMGMEIPPSLLKQAKMVYN